MKDRVVIIAQVPSLVARLLSPLASAELRIDVLTSAGSRQFFSRYVSTVTLLQATTGKRRKQYRALAASLAPHDWVLLASDADIRDVWDAACQDATIDPLLPFESRRYALGSKSRMRSALAELGVEQPRSVFVDTGGDINAAIAEVGGDAIAKPDPGEAGIGVMRYTPDQSGCRSETSATKPPTKPTSRNQAGLGAGVHPLHLPLSRTHGGSR